MADRTNSRPPPRPQGPPPGRQRETADERRTRQTAAAIEKQADLKREAAERRHKKEKA